MVSVGDLSELIATLRHRLAENEAEGQKLRDAIAVLTRQRPRPVSDSSAGGRSSTSGLVLEIINGSSSAWAIFDLQQEMYRRGWDTAARSPIDALRASVERLAKLGQIERRGKGLYGRVEVEPLVAPVAGAPPVEDEDDPGEVEWEDFDPPSPWE